MIGGKVISLEMIEIEMGDRGSKSDNVCKRATSRWFFSIFNTVRCTLVAGKAGSGVKLRHTRI
jgi:hypothetical protein